MIGLGTLINCAFVILGGLIGLLFGRALKADVQRVMTCACGLSTIFIGASGALARMLTLSGGSKPDSACCFSFPEPASLISLLMARTVCLCFSRRFGVRRICRIT